MTGSVVNRRDVGQNSPVNPVELVADMWFIIMSLLSPSDIVRLSLVSAAI